MFKRLIVFSILASMLLHSAARLGVLDSLYQQRHQVAYHLGLIAEIPIAICSGDYDFNNKLNFQSDNSDKAAAPIGYHAREITLFFLMECLELHAPLCLSDSRLNVKYLATSSNSPDRTIFQPPKI